MPTRTLTVVTGDSAGTSVDVAGEIVVGREGADLPLPDEQISRRHAAVRSVDDGIEVEDLGSLNGTFVDGRRLEGPVTVQSAAALRVGTTEMSLAIEAPEPEAAPDVTVFRDVIPTPEVTRAREIPTPEVTRAREIPTPEVTRAREIPTPEVTRAREIPVPEARAAPEAPGAPAAGQAAPAGGRGPLVLVGVAFVIAIVVVVLFLLLR
jgi:pSer/pThr/pTyr-binding forkhead associated (FHA) protein